MQIKLLTDDAQTCRKPGTRERRTEGPADWYVAYVVRTEIINIHRDFIINPRGASPL